MYLSCFFGEGRRQLSWQTLHSTAFLSQLAIPCCAYCYTHFYNQIEMWKPWLAQGYFITHILQYSNTWTLTGFLVHLQRDVIARKHVIYPLLKPYGCVEVRVSLRLFYNSNYTINLSPFCHIIL